MKADDLLCSRNAREEKGSLVLLLLAERARSECARSTRAIEDRPAHPLKRKVSKLGGSTTSLDARSGRSISLHPASCLLLGAGEGNRVLHVVCSPKDDYLAIITAYVPDPDQWSADYKRRQA